METPDKNVGTHGSCVRNTTNTDLAQNVAANEPCVRYEDNAHRELDTADARSVRSYLPARKSPRANFHNYSGGEYFITICTQEKYHYFGEINAGKMHLSEIGKYCDEQLSELSLHYPYVEIPLYIVMPNHIHAIICINNDNRTHEPCVPTKRTALSVVIGGLKRSVTLYARRNDINFAWQSRYHDHIIRNHNDGNNIANYIETNVERWTTDCFY